MGDTEPDRCVVRVNSAVWSDNRGLHIKKSVTLLRRQCVGFNLLEEDLSSIGAEEVADRITNLNDVNDGVYELTVCNESYDRETGIIDDYDYKLTEV